ncbi:MAG: class I SAM-dependent methyltransferase [Clostridia bacterium]|nr:class I SAM-dependent methyltransferase [Clostridia bacterium]
MIPIIPDTEEQTAEAERISRLTGLPVSDAENRPSLYLLADEDGLSLTDGNVSLRGDFSKMLRRTGLQNLRNELLIRAAAGKGIGPDARAVDATAGLGEDSFLLAAFGFTVELYEYDPVVFALLSDAHRRAAKDLGTAKIAGRMNLHFENSETAMRNLPFVPDVIYLDPMFPEKQKNSLTKKKLQMIHLLQPPCTDEKELLDAAAAASPQRIVIKRPKKAPPLGGVTPGFSLPGKNIRYDCIVTMPRQSQ